MNSETVIPSFGHSLPVPTMYPEQNSNPISSSANSPGSSVNTTPSSGIIQPWLNSSRASPANDGILPGSSIPTPPTSSTSMMQQPMNMMHPIYMYSSPYFQYPPNMMYPYSSMFQPQMVPPVNQQHSTLTSSVSPKIPSSPETSTVDSAKNQPRISMSSIPQSLSYSNLTATPVQQQLARSDRRSSLSSECSSSPSDTNCSRTDVSVDCPTSDSELSRTNDSGNSSMGCDSTNSSPAPEPVAAPTTVVKKIPTPPPKSSPEPLYKKKARTNYTPEQVRGLEKIFLETPYPESEAMESLSKDLDIPEQKLKVWFQNKRARWRRRVQDTKHPLSAVPQMYMPTMMSPYGFMPTPAMPAANPMMPGSYYPYQQAASASFNSPMQKYGFTGLY